jgi:hypothetical protein
MGMGSGSTWNNFVNNFEQLETTENYLKTIGNIEILVYFYKKMIN